MATPTLAGFKARFPEFEALGISDATIQVYLDDGIDHLDDTAWGDCYERAVYYWSAHNLTINQQRSQAVVGAGLSGAVGTTGPVSSAGADGLSVSYASGKSAETSTEEWYGRTSYGQEYLALMGECLTGARVASCL